MPGRQRFAYFLMFTTPFFWAANYIVARSAIGVIQPHLLAFLRWLLAFGLMLVFAGPELHRLWPAWRREWPDLLLLGALGMWICGAFVYIGAHTTAAVNISLLYAVAPVLIAVASAIWFRERLGWAQIVGVVLALAGTLTVIAKGAFGSLASVRFSQGDLWVLSAVLAWTVYSLMLRSRPTVLGPFARLTVITLGGLVVLAPLTVVEGMWLGWPEFTPYLWLLVVVVALLPGFGAYQAYSFIQRELGAARAGLILYLGPLYSALVAWALLGEVPQWYHGLGALLILPGIWLATRSPATVMVAKPAADG